MSRKQDVIDKLKEIHLMMQLAGENRFRAIAFDRAARTLESMSESFDDVVSEGRLTELKGIGSSIAEDIQSFLETGEVPVLVDLRERVPAGLMEWLDISGLGPKNIVKIHKELGITERDELLEACRDGRVASLSGLGEKSADRIARSIEWLQENQSRALLSEASLLAEPFLESLGSLESVERVDVAGSLRRQRETIGDIDILVAARPENAASIIDHFAGLDTVVDELGRGETKCSVRVQAGRQVDLRVVTLEQWPAALLYFTGSKEHNVMLRGRARDRGWVLNEYGLFHQNEERKADRERPVDVDSEEAIYRALELHPVPPELREGMGEEAVFERGEGPELIREREIRGVVHTHSTWSDGKSSVEEMARAAMQRGFEYLVMSDHSKSAAYAGGLSEEEVKRQWEEIDTLNEALKSEGTSFEVFKGIESDILADGSLDYDDDLLEGFDLVIASVHSGLEMDRKKMTERFLRAIDHPATRMIGHPTGRLLLRRGESELDMEAIIHHAAEQGVAIEVNANPWRLDLDWRWGIHAREAGLLTSINPDAHTTEGIDDIRWGVSTARKGWFTPDRVVNSWPLERFREWVRGEKRG